MIREAISAAAAGESLSMNDAIEVMREVMEGEATPAQLGAYLTALALKGETPEEIAGFATVMREKSLRVDPGGTAIDTCGTGGDRKGTFNISTAAAFVVAGAGLTVAKHGNRAASGDCGSADVLEALGVQIELPPEGVERCLREIGIGFMFAPAYHPAMRYAAPVRREIGIRTVFNVLGPITNPAGVSCQLIGVGYPELARKVAEALQLFGTHHAIIVHSDDGMDEISLGSDTNGWEVLGRHDPALPGAARPPGFVCRYARRPARRRPDRKRGHHAQCFGRRDWAGERRGGAEQRGGVGGGRYGRHACGGHRTGPGINRRWQGLRKAGRHGFADTTVEDRIKCRQASLTESLLRSAKNLRRRCPPSR